MNDDVIILAVDFQRRGRCLLTLGRCRLLAWLRVVDLVPLMVLLGHPLSSHRLGLYRYGLSSGGLKAAILTASASVHPVKKCSRRLLLPQSVIQVMVEAIETPYSALECGPSEVDRRLEAESDDWVLPWIGRNADAAALVARPISSHKTPHYVRCRTLDLSRPIVAYVRL